VRAFIYLFVRASLRLLTKLSRYFLRILNSWWPCVGPQHFPQLPSRFLCTPCGHNIQRHSLRNSPCLPGKDSPQSNLRIRGFHLYQAADPQISHKTRQKPGHFCGMLHSLPHRTILHPAAQSRTCGRFRTKELVQATRLHFSAATVDSVWHLCSKIFLLYGYHSAH
jgi:hypothetical protein